jgi:hypothetical protein
MKLKHTKTLNLAAGISLFLIFFLSFYSLQGQTVRYRIGTNATQNNVYPDDSTAFITGRFTAVGRPTNGIRLYSQNSGAWQDSSILDAKSSYTTRAYKTPEGGYVMSGRFYFVRGESADYKILIVKPNGSVNISASKSIEGGEVEDFLIFGDTLVGIVTFTKINTATRTEVISLNIRTGEVFDWSPAISGNNISLYQTDGMVIFSGDEISLNGENHKSTISYSKKSLTIDNAIRLKSKINFLTEDSSHYYIGGDNLNYSKEGVVGDFVIEDFESGTYTQFPHLEPYYGIRYANDEKGGMYIGARSSKYGIGYEDNFFRIDSNLQIDSMFNFELNGSITDLVYHKDTLFVSGAFTKANNADVSQPFAYVTTTGEIVQLPFLAPNCRIKHLGGNKLLAYNLTSIDGINVSKSAVLDYKTGLFTSLNTDLVSPIIVNDTVYHSPLDNLENSYSEKAFKKVERSGDLSKTNLANSFGTGLCIVSDKNGGYYVSGNQFEYNVPRGRINGVGRSYVTHVLPDGSSDKDFDIYSSNLNLFSDLVLFGDTLFTCGDRTGKYDVFQGISAINVKTKKVVKNHIGKGTKVLELYDGLLYSSTEVIDPKTFTKTDLNLNANSYANSDSFVYFNGQTNVRGQFEYCLSRFRKNGLSIDTSFFFVVSRSIKEILLYDDKIILAPFRLNEPPNTINGQAFNSLITIDINTKQIDSLNLKLSAPSAYQRFNMLYERNDTLYVGGKIIEEGYDQPTTLVSYDLIGDKVIYRYENLGSEVNEFLIDNEINVLGDNLLFNQGNGILSAVDLKINEAIQSPSIQNTSWIKNGLYTSISPIIDESSVFYANNMVLKVGEDSSRFLHRFSRNDQLYQKWSINYDGIPKIFDAMDMRDDILVGVTLDTSYAFRKLISVSKNDGTVSSRKITFEDDITGILNFQGKPLIIGKFDLLNEKFGGNLLKVNKVSNEVSPLTYLSADNDSLVGMKHHQSKLFLFSNLIDEPTIYCLTTRAAGSGLDTLCAIIGNESVSIKDVYFKDNLLYLTGDFDSIIINDVSFKRLSGACINFEQKTMEPWDPKFYNAPQILDVSDSFVYTHGEVGSLGNVITNPSVISFMPKSGEFKNAFHPDSISSNATVYSFGDTLIIVDQGISFGDSTTINFFNKRTVSWELNPWKIPSPFLINDIIKKDNKFYVAGRFSFVNAEPKSNFFIYDIGTKALVPNTPNFYGDVYDLLLRDSMIYIAGKFRYVDARSTDQIATINIKSNDLKTYDFGFSNSTTVYSVSIVDSICYLIVRGFPEADKGVFSFNLNEDKSLSIPFEFPFSVSSLTQLSDKILINAPQSHLYNFKTGKPHPFLSSRNVRSDNMLFFDTTAIAVSRTYDVSNINHGVIAEIDFPSWFIEEGIADNYPKAIGQVPSFEMTCSGNNINQSSKIYFVQNGDTLRGISNSYSFSNDNTLVCFTLDSTIGKLGLYDLIQELPSGKTSVIPKALNIEVSEEKSVVSEILGRDLIRSDEWMPYSLRITNNSNVERKLIPAIVTIDSRADLLFEVAVFSDTGASENIVSSSLDSVAGGPRAVNVFGLMVPQLSANESISIPFKVKAISDSFKIEARVLGSLESNLHVDNKTSKAYSTLLSDSLSTTCFDSLVLSLWNKRRVAGSSSSFTKPRVVDYSTFVSSLSTCGTGNSSGFDELLRLVLNDRDSAKISPFLSTVYMPSLHNGEAPFTFDLSSEKVVSVVNSYDPNVKIGNKGVGNKNYMKAIPSELFYQLHFENDSSATAPLHKLLILDTLDTEVLDPSTLRFEEIVIGESRFSINGLAEVNHIIGKNEDENAWIYCVAKVLSNGVVQCKLEAYNLDARTKTSEPLVGFLPPNRLKKEGQGMVSFSVKRRESARLIENRVGVYFDKNDVVLTPTWRMTLDDDVPESRLKVQGYTKGKLGLTIDATDGTSGIENVEIYYSTDRANYNLLMSAGVRSNVTTTMQPDQTIYLYSIAIDSVGRREETPLVFDDSMTLSQPKLDFGEYFSVFPNPSNGFFKIYSFFDSKVDVDIYNLEGKKMYSADVDQLETKEVHLDVRGLYFIGLTSNSGEVTHKKVLIF